MSQTAQSSYALLLHDTLQALQFSGTAHTIREAMPAHGQLKSLRDFRNTLAQLGYATHIQKVGTVTLHCPLPCLYLNRNNEPVLLQDHSDTTLLSGESATILTFEPAVLPMMRDDHLHSLWSELKRFHPILINILAISLVIGLASLAPIFYNRSLYDHILASGSFYGLPMMVVGVFLALGTEMTLRHMRNKNLGRFGARLDHFFSCSIFERLLFMPPLYTERTPQTAQLNRLRDFENVREFFTGPLASLLFELPLIGLYTITMGFIGGPLALVPVALLGAYALLLRTALPQLNRYARTTADRASQKQDFLLETLTKLESIRLNGMEKIWQQRYNTLSAKTAEANFNLSYTAQAIEISSYVLMTLGGLITLCWGVTHVLSNDLTAGALMASMMLVWRIIAPLQICCASISRFGQIHSSMKQARRLLSSAPESNPYSMSHNTPHLSGRISMHRVSLRYGAEMEPALLGVSMDIQPGQIIAIRGANGSGKSTILKLILGFYQPQNSSVRLDGVDLRQYDPRLLRQAMAYVPQHVELFPGTIRDNLLFTAPNATDADCLRALNDANALEDINVLPQGLDTLIEEQNTDVLSFMVRQRLNLARAYLKDAPILLLDEAMQTLGSDNEAFIRKINALRGKTTVLLVTHREDHMQLADQLLVMNKGELTHMGPSQQVLKVLRGAS